MTQIWKYRIKQWVNIRGHVYYAPQYRKYWFCKWQTVVDENYSCRYYTREEAFSSIERHKNWIKEQNFKPRFHHEYIN